MTTMTASKTEIAAMQNAVAQMVAGMPVTLRAHIAAEGMPQDLRLNMGLAWRDGSLGHSKIPFAVIVAAVENRCRLA